MDHDTLLASLKQALGINFPCEKFRIGEKSNVLHHVLCASVGYRMIPDHQKPASLREFNLKMVETIDKFFLLSQRDYPHLPTSSYKFVAKQFNAPSIVELIPPENESDETKRFCWAMFQPHGDKGFPEWREYRVRPVIQLTFGTIEDLCRGNDQLAIELVYALADMFGDCCAPGRLWRRTLNRGIDGNGSVNRQNAIYWLALFLSPHNLVRNFEFENFSYFGNWGLTVRREKFKTTERGILDSRLLNDELSILRVEPYREHLKWWAGRMKTEWNAYFKLIMAINSYAQNKKQDDWVSKTTAIYRKLKGAAYLAHSKGKTMQYLTESFILNLEKCLDFTEAIDKYDMIPAIDNVQKDPDFDEINAWLKRITIMINREKKNNQNEVIQQSLRRIVKNQERAAEEVLTFFKERVPKNKEEGLDYFTRHAEFAKLSYKTVSELKNIMLFDPSSFNLVEYLS